MKHVREPLNNSSSFILFLYGNWRLFYKFINSYPSLIYAIISGSPRNIQAKWTNRKQEFSQRKIRKIGVPRPNLGITLVSFLISLCYSGLNRVKRNYLNGKLDMHIDSLKTTRGSYSGINLSIHIEKYKIFLVTQSL